GVRRYRQCRLLDGLITRNRTLTFDYRGTNGVLLLSNSCCPTCAPDLFHLRHSSISQRGLHETRRRRCACHLESTQVEDYRTWRIPTSSQPLRAATNPCAKFRRSRGLRANRRACRPWRRWLVPLLPLHFGQ